MEEVIIPVGEFCNKIVTDQEGTKLYVDKELVREVIEMLEGLVDER